MLSPGIAKVRQTQTADLLLGATGGKFDTGAKGGRCTTLQFHPIQFKRFRAAAVGPVLLRLQGNEPPKGATNARAAPCYTTMVGISRKLRGSSPGIRRNRLEGRRYEGMNSIEFC